MLTIKLRFFMAAAIVFVYVAVHSLGIKNILLAGR